MFSISKLIAKVTVTTISSERSAVTHDLNWSVILSCYALFGKLVLCMSSFSMSLIGPSGICSNSLPIKLPKLKSCDLCWSLWFVLCFNIFKNSTHYLISRSVWQFCHCYWIYFCLTQLWFESSFLNYSVDIFLNLTEFYKV